jgi:hypothetical protein
LLFVYPGILTASEVARSTVGVEFAGNKFSRLLEQLAAGFYFSGAGQYTVSMPWQVVMSHLGAGAGGGAGVSDALIS